MRITPSLLFMAVVLSIAVVLMAVPTLADTVTSVRCGTYIPRRHPGKARITRKREVSRGAPWAVRPTTTPGDDSSPPRRSLATVR